MCFPPRTGDSINFYLFADTHTHIHTHTQTHTHTHTHTHREPGSSSDTGFSPASRRQHRPFYALWAGPILFPGKKSTLIHTAWTSESPAGCPGPWHTTLLVRVLKLKAQGANSTCLQFWLAGSVFKCECGSCSLSLLAPGYWLYSSPLPNSSSPQFPHFLYWEPARI